MEDLSNLIEANIIAAGFSQRRELAMKALINLRAGIYLTREFI